MYKIFKLHRNEEGQSLVEFALILPVLLMILLGLVEFGLLLNAQISMTSAAREGARILAIQEIKEPFDNASVELILSGPINSNTEHITFKPETYDIVPEIVNSGSIFSGKVTVSGNVKNIIRLYMAEYVYLEGEASMRLENYKP